LAVCDGCGTPVEDPHIRQRIERLELATRFRPIHIQVLLMDVAPAVRPEDYFYRAAVDRSKRSVTGRMFFDEMVRGAGMTLAPEIDEQAALAEFQRRGFFLAHAVECPIEGYLELGQAVRRFAAVVVRRIETSYKPKRVALLSHLSRELIPLLYAAGWGDRLILDSGEPFVDPFLGDPMAQAEFGTALGERLAKACAGSL
jgi:hypothetical protein